MGRTCGECGESFTFKKKNCCSQCGLFFCSECVVKQDRDKICMACMRDQVNRKAIEDILLSEETDLSDLECPICFEIMNNAFETICGHAYCEYCINKSLENSQYCPICKEEASPIHPSYILRKIIVKRKPPLLVNKVKESLRTANQEKEKGNSYYKDGKYADAIKCYQMALFLDPKLSAAYANIAMTYMNLGQYRLAIEQLDNCISNEEGYLKAYVRKGLCLEKLGKFQEALTVLHEADVRDSATPGNAWRVQIRSHANRISKKI